jgi:hypothetical protein
VVENAGDRVRAWRPRVAGVAEVLHADWREHAYPAHRATTQRGLPLAVYTRDMFGTGHDAANRAAVRAVPSAELDVVGIGLYGGKNVVDKVVKGARLHP